MARTCSGLGSPSHVVMNRSTTVGQDSISEAGTSGRSPRADLAAYDSTAAVVWASWSLAVSSEMSSSGAKPRDVASRGSEAWTSTRTLPDRNAGSELSTGNVAPKASSTSSAQMSSNPTRPTRSSRSTPRYRSDPPSLSGSAISVWNATTPSSPGMNVDPLVDPIVDPLVLGIMSYLHVEDAAARMADRSDFRRRWCAQGRVERGAVDRDELLAQRGRDDTDGVVRAHHRLCHRERPPSERL